MGNCLTKCKSCFTDLRQENPPAASSSTELPGENPTAASSSTELLGENPAAASSSTKLPGENPTAVSFSAKLPGENPAAALSPAKLPGENPPPASSSTNLPEELHECIDLFKEIKDTSNIDELIHMIHQLLQRIKSKQQNNLENASTSSQLTQEREEKSGIWTFITNKGSQFLECLNKFGSSEGLHQGIKVVAETLQQVGQINSAVAGLSTIAFVLSKYEKMRDNQPECLEVMGDLIDLARHLQSLKKMIPQEEEKFMNAIELIIEGSITCLYQLKDNMLFRFIKSSVNSENLTNVRKRINGLYPDLVLTVIMDMRKDIPTYLPITKPVYPEKAVGIDEQVNVILDILNTTGDSSLAVVIYGCGGLGKTTVAEAVVSKIDTKEYDYTSLEIYQEQEKNDLRRSQQRILKDCFPMYNGGKPIMLTDCKDGRGHLMEAFKCQRVKPFFLFIDNALRSADLKDLLPQNLGDLPQRSRILVTTRHLAATDMFQEQPNLVRHDYSLNPLPDEDALKILLKDPIQCATIKKEDLNRILKICSGVPLALTIVGAQLHKQSYRVERCANILENLEKGQTIKEEKLSERLIDFVYGELEEDIQEALLDICYFFSKWSRENVEYIVGATAVTSLLEAGLVTSTPKQREEQSDKFSTYDSLGEKLVVHDIIKAKARGLAKGNRILDYQSLCEAADEQRLNQIKGVWLVNEESEHVIEERHLNLMRKSLRVLALGEGMKVSTVSQMRFEKLKFLQLSYKLPQLPVKLEMLDNLRVFHGPFFTEGGISLCKLPKSLLSMKVIGPFDFTECANSQMTGASSCLLEKLDLSELEEPPAYLDSSESEELPEKLDFSELDLSELEELPKLPEGFNQLKALKILILDGKEKMSELPEEICQRPALEVLSMRMCQRLKCLPESFGRLITLTYLDLFGCRDFQKLSHTFGQFTALKNLNLSGCEKLEVLPDTFGQLTVLRDLDLSVCLELEALPDTFGQLTALRVLNLSWCEKLEALPDTFGQLTALRDLNLSRCEKLEALPDTFGQLTALRDLNLSVCIKLEALPDTFGQLTTLRDLNLYGCSKLKALPDTFGQLTALRDLNLCRCIKLKALPDTFGQFTALRDLNLSWFVELEALPDTFGQLTALRDLNLSVCEKLEALPDTFGQLTALRVLNLSWCLELEALPDTFGQLTALRDLNLSGCEKLEALPNTFGQLTALRVLNLSECIKLETLPDTFEQLTTLRKLNLDSCFKLKTLPNTFKQLTSLKNLDSLIEKYNAEPNE